MKTIIFAFLIMAAFPADAADADPSALPPSQATPVETSHTEVTDVYAYATAPNQKNGAVFLTISNQGNVAERLTAASAEIAESAALHTNVIEEDTVTMTKVDGYDIAPDNTLVLDPRGHHIMLMNLKHSLKKGDTFPLQLTFAKKGNVTIDVSVRAAGEAAATKSESGIGDDAPEPPTETHEHHH
jgi:periplasmic copper chaperone A